MSIQTDIETALGAMLETQIVAVGNVGYGSITQPRVEGNQRYAAVRLTSASGTREQFGQIRWTETYKLTIWWARTVTRATAITEWEAFEDAMRVDQYLALSSIRDAFLTAKAWADVEGQWLTMSADVEVLRVE